jgi:ribosomal protein L32
VTTGTRRHAFLKVVHVLAWSLNNKEGTARHRVSLEFWCPMDTWRFNDHRVEVLMTCPKCGETRLIERVDTHRWFCAVCAHSWTIRAS